MKKENMCAMELARELTNIRRKDRKAWANDYSEELCKRCKIEDEYKADPEAAVKKAGHMFGIYIF